MHRLLQRSLDLWEHLFGQGGPTWRIVSGSEVFGASSKVRILGEPQWETVLSDYIAEEHIGAFGGEDGLLSTMHQHATRFRHMIFKGSRA